MKNKTLAFTKNAIISSAAMIAAAKVSSEFASEYIQNGKIIGAIATAVQYAVGYGVFLPLQAWDNRDVYQTPEGKFDSKQFAVDNAKFGVSFLALDAVYLATRPFLQDFFIKKGMDAGSASVVSDSVYISIYAVAGYLLAKATGVIKAHSLEDTLKPNP